MSVGEPGRESGERGMGLLEISVINPADTLGTQRCFYEAANTILTTRPCQTWALETWQKERRPVLNAAVRRRPRYWL